MPNWTSNRLQISGDKARLVKVRDFIKNDKEALDFEKIVPMPKLIKNTGSGSRKFGEKTIEAWYVNNAIEDIVEREESSREFTDEEKLELAKIGFVNWYEWSISNWGVKWNASSIELDDSIEYGELIYKFITPWNAPVPILFKLRELYPELEFELTYRNEDDPEYPHNADE